jgi:hypothetical protein
VFSPFPRRRPQTKGGSTAWQHFNDNFSTICLLFIFVASALMRPQCAFLASAITVSCCVCLVTALKRAFRLECIDGHDLGPSGSALLLTITSLLVAAVLAFAATLACLVRPLSKSAAIVAAAVCSKWQPVYFIVVSVQKVTLRAIVIAYACGSTIPRRTACHVSADFENQCLAATLVWDCAVLLAGVCVIYVDIDPHFTPVMRRCAQHGLALCLCVDAVGSYIWGNDFAGMVSVSVSSFDFVLNSQMTSCITSQAVLGVYFAYVGWRSRYGRGWYYASLRFELDECGRASLSRPSAAHITLTQVLNERLVTSSSSSFDQASAVTSKAAAAPDGLYSEAGWGLYSEAGWGLCSTVLSRARRPFLHLQQRLVSNCRVFAIPCVALNGRAAGGAEFALARPAFDLRFLRPLQRIADAHPKFYWGFIFFGLVVPSFILAIALKPQIRDIPYLFLISAAFIFLLGFVSSRRYNLDRVAVKHVVFSFRFPIFVVLLSQWIALEARQAHLVLKKGPASNYDTTPWDVAARTIMALCFCLCLLFDCSPQLPVIIQTLVTV